VPRTRHLAWRHRQNLEEIKPRFKNRAHEYEQHGEKPLWTVRVPEHGGSGVHDAPDKDWGPRVAGPHPVHDQQQARGHDREGQDDLPLGDGAEGRAAASGVVAPHADDDGEEERHRGEHGGEPRDDEAAGVTATVAPTAVAVPMHGGGGGWR